MFVCIKLRYKKTRSKKDAQIEDFKIVKKADFASALIGNMFFSDKEKCTIFKKRRGKK